MHNQYEVGHDRKVKECCDISKDFVADLLWWDGCVQYIKYIKSF